MSFADDDGDADMVALTPAPNQLAPVPDSQPSKKPPRRGCGVCRTCLFATGQGCLAFKTQADLERSTQRHRQVKQDGESKARKRERALGVLAPVPGAAAGGACRVCAHGTHGANKCPLHTVLEVLRDAGDVTDDQRWAEALDEPMRQVLLAVQQLASAQVLVYTNKQGPKPTRPAPIHSLSAQQLRAVQDVLTRDSLRQL